NLGILSALASAQDVIYSDALNHASLIDGARLSRAAVEIFPHRDVSTLSRLLASGRGAHRRIIATESLFSMDGDEAPLGELAALAHQHDALLLVDEAHSAGAVGPTGRGLAVGLDVDLQMGTLGKALGAFGAYVAGRRELVDL